ncbi:MAG: hypothetical protein WD225_00125, partial [Ilumatobacteraceae bacterium]
MSRSDDAVPAPGPRAGDRGRTLLVRIPSPDDAAAATDLCGSLRARLLASGADVAVLDVAALAA